MSDNSDNKPSFKIDLSYLKEVSSGSSEFMVEMIELFLDQTPGYFASLDEAIKDKNWIKVAEVAHKIKPTLAFVGADLAKESMGEIENKARNETDLESIPQTFNQLYSFTDELFALLREARQELENS